MKAVWKALARSGLQPLSFLLLPVVISLACAGPAALEPVGPQALTCDPVEQFERYRYEVGLTLEVSPLDDPAALAPFRLVMEADGAVQGRDRQQARFHYPEGGLDDVEIVRVGERYWDNVGLWAVHDVDPNLPPISYLPLDLCKSLAPDIVAARPSQEREEVNGISARRYHFDALPTQFSGRLWGSQSDMASFVKEYTLDLWMAEKGTWPVRFQISGSGSYENGQQLSVAVSLELREINDKSIKIEPPVE